MIPESTITVEQFKQLDWDQCNKIFGFSTVYVYRWKDGVHRITQAGYTYDKVPDFMAKVRTASQGLSKVLGGFIDSTQRTTICKNCEFYRNSVCLSCGCYIDIKAKIKYEQCPEGKW